MSEPCQTCDRDQCHAVTVMMLINLLLHDENQEGKDERRVWWLCFQSTDNQSREKQKGMLHTSKVGLNKD